MEVTRRISSFMEHWAWLRATEEMIKKRLAEAKATEPKQETWRDRPPML